MKRCVHEAIGDLITLEFFPQAINAVFIGPNGVGKTTIARNIAYAAVLKGNTLRFVTASEMLNELASHDSASTLRRRLKLYTQPQLLCIDEIGYLSYSNRHADLLFEIISQRYEQKSTLVTTNKPFAEWSEVFPTAACVVTLVDRLVHQAEILSFEGESYRLEEAKGRTSQRKKRRALPSERSLCITQKTNPNVPSDQST